MATPGLGFKSYAQIAPQTAWGSTATTTKRFELINWKVDPVQSIISDPSLNNSPSKRGLYQGPLYYKGTFDVRLNYAGLEELLRAVTGTYAFARSFGAVVGPISNCSQTTAPAITRLTGSFIADGVQVGHYVRNTGTPANIPDNTYVTSVSALSCSVNNALTAQSSQSISFTPFANDHTFTEGATLKSYTIEVSVGDVTANTVFRLVDAKIVELTVKCSAGTGTDAMAIATFTVIARDQTPGASPASLTPPAIYPVKFDQLVTIVDGTSDTSSTSIRLRGLEFSLKNPHAEDRFYMGSLGFDEPVRADFLTVSYKLTQEFITLSAYNALRSFTTGTLDFLFQQPSLYSPTYHREIELRSTSANLKSLSAPVDGYKVIVATSEWEGFYSATDGGAYLLRNRNDDATLT